MKICVLIKQVPDKESVIRITADGTWVQEKNLVFVTNESDTYALEEALRIKDVREAEVVVCTMGPERAQQSLKDALAKGADRALFINDGQSKHSDSLMTAEILAEVLKNEGFDLIFTGTQSDDTGCAQLGPMLAEFLNLPHATLVVETHLENGTMTVKQELEGGWFQKVALTLPALLTIQSGLNKPRYASLRGIMAMKSKEIRVINAGDLSTAASGLSPLQMMERLYVPPKMKETVLLEGTPDEVVSQLVDKLTNEIKVL